MTKDRQHFLIPDWIPIDSLSTKKKRSSFTILFEELATPISSKSFSILVLFLVFTGLVFVHSASINLNSTLFGVNSFLIKQSIYISIGLSIYFGMTRVSFDFFKNKTPYFVIFTFILLALVQVPGLGKEVNGAQRWIGLGIFNLQPAELLKLSVVLYTADYCVRKQVLIKTEYLRSFIPFVIVILCSAFLLLIQPDFGSLVVVCSTIIAILIMGGMSWRLFFSILFIMASFIVLLINISPYRMARWTAFTDPWSDPYGSSYQLVQSLIAVGQGGWFGQGLGESLIKLSYLPEAHTDFILAVIIEETGLFGFFVLLCLFYLLIFQCFRIGRAAVKEDLPFQGMVAKGVGIWIAIQFCINAGVNLGLLPTKGLTLPLMSYGGSGIIVALIMLGLVHLTALETERKKQFKINGLQNTHQLSWKTLNKNNQNFKSLK